ncbi:hypothetical protein CPARA_3gp422 (nucleomorph) [Cryptomonas paramecium]|uniref:Uncharacterized protein n=1 Tax=Cryptomonas paramaecium TaxID=2898 RepID=F2HIF6_9CRYP|nr:hypothetical protein CPARA_3gp422 [Cryptomonas paramecium]AEA39080.1 hypothetical protein CPARA_3gp422 [Cryptomonas paramecium]|mmetsp:Transcript_37353/g.99448  ORF Transcript_37353/g.99448 Transcript_37353/m.99448 type:complete len:514 (-) Transcript_37353:14539-16080(-)
MKTKLVAVDQSRQYICMLSEQNNLECFKTTDKNCISFCEKSLIIKKNFFRIELKSFFSSLLKKSYTKQFLNFYVFLFSINNIYILNTGKKRWINIQMKKCSKNFNASNHETYILSDNDLFVFDNSSGEILKKINIKYFVIFDSYLNAKISKNNQYLFFQAEPLVLISLNFGCVLQHLQNNAKERFTVSFLNHCFLILLFENNSLRIWNFKKNKLKKINLFFNFEKIRIQSLKKIFIQKQFFLALFSEKILFLCSLKKFNDLSNVKIKILFLVKFCKKICSIWILSKSCLFFIFFFNKKKIIPIKLNLNSLKFSANTYISLSKLENQHKSNIHYIHSLLNNFKNFFKTNLYLVSKKIPRKNNIQFINVKFKAEKKYFIKVKKINSNQFLNIFSFLIATKETANLKQFLKINKTYNLKLMTISDKFYILPLVMLSIQEILHTNQKKEYYFAYINHVIFYHFSCLTKENFLKYFLKKIENSKKNFVTKKILHSLLLKMNMLKNQNEKYALYGFINL